MAVVTSNAKSDRDLECFEFTIDLNNENSQTNPSKIFFQGAQGDLDTVREPVVGAARGTGGSAARGLASVRAGA